MADTLVLCYHAISERWHADLSVTPAAFAEQIEHLQRRGYRGVTFADAVQVPSKGRRVAVTFDDAFLSVREHGRAVLDAAGWPGTVFAVSRFAESREPLRWDGIDHWHDTEFAPELACMGWEELRALADAGWEIGSHTVTHPHLTRVADEQLAEELTRSRTEVEAALGGPCPTLAYPYGDVDQRVIDAARVAGYSAASALPGRFAHPAALEWPRVGVYHPDDMRRFKLKTARQARRLHSRLRR